MRMKTEGAPWLAAVPLLAALIGAGTAAAQMDVEDDVGDLYGGGVYGGAGGTWVEGGGGVRLAGSLGPRAVPDAHVVRRGDTLWDITGHYFGNPWEWPRIWSYNPDITNPHWIYPDDRIRLKSPEGTITPLPGAGEGAGQNGDGVGIRVVEPRPQDTRVVLDDQGYIDRDALATAGIIAGSPEEHMLLSTYDEVYVKFEEDTPVQRGKVYTVFRRIQEDERLEDEEGELVRIFGAIRVQSYDSERKVARAVIVEALDPIERGFRVADVPRQFRMVPPARNEKDVDAEVVATLRPRSLMADQQIIFVNAGAEDGVEVGNRFFIVERGDAWRSSLTVSEREMGAQAPGEGEELEEYPPEVVAEARVVDVRPSSSALIVTRSLREVSLGHQARMRKGF